MMRWATFALVVIISSFDNAKAQSPTSIIMNGKKELVTTIATVSSSPKCEFILRNATCCLTVSAIQQNENVDVCTRIEMDVQRRLFVTLQIKGMDLITSGVKVGDQCTYLPGTQVPVCLKTYYTFVDRQQNSIDSCFLASVNNMLYLDFQCIKYNSGWFEHNSELTAESEGVYDEIEKPFISFSN